MSKFHIENRITSKAELLELAQTYGNIYHQQDDTLNEGVVTIHYNTDVPKYAYGNRALFPHTDRSNLENPPDFALLWLEKKAYRGGDTLLFDASEHLLPNIDLYNFRAIFSSENDTEFRYDQLYNTEKNLFRFRNDDYLFCNDVSHAIKQLVVEVIQKQQILLELDEGDCIIINNKQLLHGRTAFLGKERIIHRVLVYKRDDDYSNALS